MNGDDGADCSLVGHAARKRVSRRAFGTRAGSSLHPAGRADATDRRLQFMRPAAQRQQR
jgi:hypothetical protein